MNQNINKAILLLDEKSSNKLTFKEVSKITGYHEKSLIRLNKDLKKYGKKLMLERIKKRHNDAISRQEKDYIINVITNYKETSLTKIYKFYMDTCIKEELFKPRSFSAVYSLIIKNDLVLCEKQKLKGNFLKNFLKCRGFTPVQG